MKRNPLVTAAVPRGTTPAATYTRHAGRAPARAGLRSPAVPAENTPRKRTSISLDATLMEAAAERARLLGYDNFSDYVAFLIHLDHQESPTHTVVRELDGLRYIATPGTPAGIEVGPATPEPAARATSPTVENDGEPVI